MLILCTMQGATEDDEQMRDSDVVAIIRSARDDPDAFAEIINRFSPLVYTVARGMFDGYRRADLDDAVSETFLKLWRTREAYDPSRGAMPTMFWVTGSPRSAVPSCAGFIATVVQMEALDALDWDATPGGDEPEAAAIAQIDEETVKAVLGDLPADVRELIVCKIFLYDAGQRHRPPDAPHRKIGRGPSLQAASVPARGVHSPWPAPLNPPCGPLPTRPAIQKGVPMKDNLFYRLFAKAEPYRHGQA